MNHEEDFKELVAQYHNLVMSLIRRYYGGRLNEYADDLSQEVWAKLWVNAKKNENNIVNFKSYLYRTVQTTLWDAIRTLDQEARLQPIWENEELEERSEELRIHDHLRIENLIQKLKPDEARMIRAYLKGFNNQEIGLMMGCSEGRVRNLLTRIKKRMAE